MEAFIWKEKLDGGRECEKKRIFGEKEVRLKKYDKQ